MLARGAPEGWLRQATPPVGVETATTLKRNKNGVGSSARGQKGGRAVGEGGEEFFQDGSGRQALARRKNKFSHCCTVLFKYIDSSVCIYLAGGGEGGKVNMCGTPLEIDLSQLARGLLYGVCLPRAKIEQRAKERKQRPL